MVVTASFLSHVTAIEVNSSQRVFAVVAAALAALSASGCGQPAATHAAPAVKAAPVRAALGAAGAASPRPGGPPAEPVAVRSADLPAGLERGACVAYPPATGNRRQTVLIDPGHGGPDPGALGVTSGGQPVTEKALALALGLKLRDLLRADGFRVVLTRSDDTSVARLSSQQVRDGALTNSGSHLDGLARVACANAAQADVLLSIHFDAYSDPTVGGAETFYDDARDFTPANLRLARLVQSGMIAAYRGQGWTTDDRGVVSDASTGSSGNSEEADAYGRLLVLGPAKPGWLSDPSHMPGVLVEPLFITDPAEADALSSAAGRAVVANGIEQGLVGFLSSR